MKRLKRFKMRSLFCGLLVACLGLSTILFAVRADAKCSDREDMQTVNLNAGELYDQAKNYDWKIIGNTSYGENTQKTLHLTPATNTYTDGKTKINLEVLQGSMYGQYLAYYGYYKYGASANTIIKITVVDTPENERQLDSFDFKTDNIVTEDDPGWKKQANSTVYKYCGNGFPKSVTIKFTNSFKSLEDDVIAITHFKKSSTGHDWGEPTYEWSKDGSTCTAKRVCKNSADHVETLEGTVTSKQTKAPTYSEMGETTYSASFTETWAKSQEKVIADIPKLPADWHEPTYEWNSDHTSCTATRVCKTDSTIPDEVIASVSVTKEETKAPTCTENGETTYTATFDELWAEEQVTTVADIAPTGHDWAETTYEWANDGSSCTAKHICNNDSIHTETDTDVISSKVSKPATCTEKGETTYTATFTKDWAASQNKVIDDIDVLTPEWNDPVYIWSDENGVIYCSATRTCKNDADYPAQSEKILASGTITKEPGCTEKGETTYTATFTVDWATPQKKVAQDLLALGHWWGEITYDWAEDGSSCVAKRTCRRDANHVEKAQASIKSAVTLAPTCTAKGERTYTATFDNDWASDQKKVIVDIPMLSPDWNEPTYEWSSDFSSCTATRTCKNDSNLPPQTANATVTSEQTAAPTCSATGVMTYTAKFSEDWAAGQVKTKVLSINADAHSWNEPTYEWSDDYTSCTASRTCKNNPAHEDSVVGQATKEVKDPTCTEKGGTTYTANFGCDWAVNQTITTSEVEALGHKWNEPTYEWAEDGKTCTATRVCANDSTHTQTSQASITSKVTVEATESKMGETTYTATFPDDWAAEQSKAITDIPVIAPDYKVIEGDGTTYTLDSEGALTFRANGNYRKFTGVKVDDNLLNTTDYDSWSGSTYVKLHPAYLKTLAVGKHKLTVCYEDGECNADFNIITTEVAPKPSDKPDTPKDQKPTNKPVAPKNHKSSPKTGDNSNMAVWMLVAFLGLGMTVICLKGAKKR